MRDIKFRSWSETLQRMFYAPTDSFSLALNDDCKHLIHIWSSDGIIDEIPVDEINQFTGIKSSDGDDVYVGDIVVWESCHPYSDSEDMTGTVIFMDGAYWIDNEFMAIPLFQETGKLSVIGNIHQNPELWEGNQ